MPSTGSARRPIRSQAARQSWTRSLGAELARLTPPLPERPARFAEPSRPIGAVVLAVPPAARSPRAGDAPPWFPGTDAPDDGQHEVEPHDERSWRVSPGRGGDSSAHHGRETRDPNRQSTHPRWQAPLTTALPG